MLDMEIFIDELTILKKKQLKICYYEIVSDFVSKLHFHF